jgi:hypothetical protein
MRTELLITDLTFMRDGRVCIAGVDRNLRTVRPGLPLPNHIYKEQLYLENGKVIRPRAGVDMFLARAPDAEIPHLEDHIWFTYGSVEVLREASMERWHNILQRAASQTVEALFGVPIHRNQNIPEGTGERSLGTLKPAVIGNLWYKGHDQRDYQYRLKFTDAAEQVFDLPINDLTFLTYIERLRKNELTLDYIMNLLLERCQRTETWLRLGLTRPFQGWCWLQITGVYTFPDYLVGKNFAELE